MDEQTGYLYRRAGLTAEELRGLVGRPPRGWSWSPASMYAIPDSPDWLDGDEGRACYGALELRWRRAGERYDVLALALAPQRLDGFTPYAAEMDWRIVTTTCLAPALPGERASERLAATVFSTPDGIAQFVALTALGGEA